MSSRPLGPRAPSTSTSQPRPQTISRSTTPTQASVLRAGTGPAPADGRTTAIKGMAVDKHVAAPFAAAAKEPKSFSSAMLAAPHVSSSSRLATGRDGAWPKVATFGAQAPELTVEGDSHAWNKDARASRRFNDINKRSQKNERQQRLMDEDDDFDVAPAGRRNRFER